MTEKLKKQVHIRNLKEGDIINDIFVVKFKKPVREYKNGYWFELRIGDSSGEMMLKFWGDNNKEVVEKIYNSIEKDGVIYVKSWVKKSKDWFEISINDPENLKVCKEDEYDLSDFILTTEKNIDEMFNELKIIIDSIKNEVFKRMLISFFNDEDFVKEFKKSPAAMYKHHGWIGGLLEHTLNVIKICKNIFEIHNDMDKDLLLTGAILHDIGKIKEFEMITSIKTSKLGMLKGHVILGLELLTEKFKELNISEDASLKLVHILLSHHGELEFGSPKIPAFPEALTVHYADEMDAKLNQMIRTKTEAVTEDDYIYTKDFGNVYLK